MREFLKVKGRTGVYQILCEPTGKMYVGSAAWCMLGRWERHVSVLRRGKHHSPYLQHSWNKYGEDAFRFSPLQFCNPDECTSLEQIWLERKQSYKPEIGFNVCRYAHSTKGREVSEETRRKISKKLTGTKLSPETVEKLRLARIGYKHSAETLEKLRRPRKRGWKFSEQGKASLKKARKKLSPITGEIALWIRENYIPQHPEFGMAAMSRTLKVSLRVVYNVMGNVTWTEPEWFPTNRVEAGPLITEVAGT